MNQGLAKTLRAAAQYRNQSATPGILPFPGVARMYKHPVYATRVTTKTCYHRLPMMDKVTKVFTRVKHMVVDRWGKGVLEMETLPDGVTRVKEQLVPVTKPARLDPQCAKAKYRALKRLARKGLLLSTAAALIAQQGKEVAS